MPIISEFFGIKIYMYWSEHYPEHFHAEYGKFKVLVSIHANWLSAREHGKISKIDPLR